MVALVAAVWALVVMWRKGVANFWRLLADTNVRYGTSFGTSPQDAPTIVGTNMHKGGVLAFDRQSRKIAYLSNGGKSIEILDYDFIKSWRVIWREKAVANGARFGSIAIGATDIRRDNVFLEITTSDIARPVLQMPMSSVRFGQETSARLKIMINAGD